MKKILNANIVNKKSYKIAPTGRNKKIEKKIYFNKSVDKQQKNNANKNYKETVKKKFDMALKYLNDESIKNPSRAELLLKEVIVLDPKNSEAINLLALLYYDDENDIKKTQEAHALFTKAVELGNSNAMYNLAIFYFYDKNDFNKNPEYAISLFKMAIKENNDNAMHDLAIIYFYGKNGIKQNTEEAINLLNESIKHRNPDAMYSLAKIYFYGENGINQNTFEGVQLFKLAVKSGNIDAMYSLAKIYFYGENGIKQNIKKAMKFFEMGIKLGDCNAMFDLARIYFYGENGIDKNTEIAFDLFKKASNLGNRDSMFCLAHIYHYGLDDMYKDIKQAIVWYMKAVELDVLDAIPSLAKAFYDLETIEVNEENVSVDYFATNFTSYENFESLFKWTISIHQKGVDTSKLYYSLLKNAEKNKIIKFTNINNNTDDQNIVSRDFIQVCNEVFEEYIHKLSHAKKIIIKDYPGYEITTAECFITGVPLSQFEENDEIIVFIDKDHNTIRGICDKGFLFGAWQTNQMNIVNFATNDSSNIFLK